MNYIQIKQVGNLQSNLNTLSDSIYQTGQYLLTTNQGTQTFEGEKTFDNEVYFNTGVRVYGTVTGEAAVFSEGPFGVGTTNPEYTLEVRSEAANITGSFLLAEGDGDTGGIEITTNTVSTYRTTITHDDTGLVFNTSSVRPYCFMDANVAIGTTSPSSKLTARIADDTAYANEAPNAVDSVVAVVNNPTVEAADNQSTLHFNLNAGTHNHVASISLVSESAGLRRGALTFCTDNGTTRPEAMRIDSAGNVGIGTTDPIYQLNVEDTADCYVGVTAGTSNAAGILFGDSSNKSIGRVTYDNSTDTMYFGTDATTISKQRRMTIDSAGNVGINHTTPDEKLVVHGDIKIRGHNRLHFGNTSDQAYINSPSSNKIVMATSATERVLIDTNGNVGIGTTAPDALLEIFGDAGASTLTALKLTNNLANDNAEGVSIEFAGNSNRIMSTIESRMRNIDSRSDLIFSTNDGSSNTSLVEYMRIDSAGNVGIGTSSPSAPLEVTSTTGGVIMPRMTTVQRNSISSPTDGEMIYNTDDNKFQGRANGAWVDLH